ncbi:hypothetical protein [uncultured Clostridium sp.]|uniref:WD40/YVTN/BNR-like repeat-containing protein n=1 Tax=uncultured Clostridium sp. TaxID=59620 RepID=UPI00262EC0E4|nr:hypothetical protein [uncultured Clostridium sp.]
MFKTKIKKVIISLIMNPILLIIYWIFFYALASLCQYGRYNNNIYILVGALIGILLITIFTIIRMKKREKDELKKKEKLNVWKYISIVIIILITAFYGFNIYKSGIKYNGKLSWVIERMVNHKSVKFENNNIYKDGVQGIFKDINKKIALPSKLFISTNFTLNYNADGTITSFDTFVYGKNRNGKEQSYLISYDSKKSKDITVILNGYANPTYNEDKLLEPLIETVSAIPFDKVEYKFNTENYGLVYYGKRDWGNNTTGMVFITRGTKEENLEAVQTPIIGYTVSIFVPGEEEDINPMRFNLINNKEWSKSKTPPTNSVNNAQNNNEDNTNNAENSKEQSYRTKEIGYRLDVTAAALGSRSYSLSKTTDSGKSWSIINENPFGDMLGVANGVKFINEQIGFIGLSKNGGTNAYLYRTDDGGKTFKQVNYPTHKIVQDGKEVSEFDFPNMPYEKDGVLEMIVGQGSDGDYLDGGTGLYESKNQGQTWSYVKEVKDNNESN